MFRVMKVPFHLASRAVPGHRFNSELAVHNLVVTSGDLRDASQATASGAGARGCTEPGARACGTFLAPFGPHFICHFCLCPCLPLFARMSH
jgi:hypothetical protein